MKKILAVLMFLTLSGCADSGTVGIGPDGKLTSVSNDTGRFTAWLLGEEARYKAIKSIEAPPVVKAEPKVLVTLDTLEKIREWTNYENIKAWKELTAELAKSLRPKNSQLDPTPFPKGAVAEGIEATGNAAQKIGNTPAAVAGVVVGAFTKVHEDSVDQAGTKVEINGTQNQVKLKNETSTAISAASDTGAATSAPKVVDPVVVDPVIVTP
jgi:hypothetical protein